MTTKDQLALDLFHAGAFKFKDGANPGWRLKRHQTNPDLPLSPCYFNLRTPENKGGPLTQPLVDRLGYALADLARETGIQPTQVCGLPKAGEPITDAFVKAYGKPIERIHLIKTGEGDQRRITGIKDDMETMGGSELLIIDDVVMGGDSKNEGIDVLSNQGGYRVDHIYVLLERGPGGRRLRERGFNVRAVWTLDEILTICQQANFITTELVQECAAYEKFLE